jgi:hypothetical protein
VLIRRASRPVVLLRMCRWCWFWLALAATGAVACAAQPEVRVTSEPLRPTASPTSISLERTPTAQPTPGSDELAEAVRAYETAYNQWMLGRLDRILTYAQRTLESMPDRNQAATAAAREEAAALLQELTSWHERNRPPAGMGPPLTEGDFADPARPTVSYGRLLLEEDRWRTRLSSLANGSPVNVLLDTPAS